MSTADFNNGLITGLALKGIPYGVTVSWQPKSIINDDTQSITIDFDRYIPDIEIENYIDALYFISTYIQDQFLIKIKGWERVNQSTIKFLLDNYFSCNGILTIIYNTKQGNLDSLPSFVVNYSPTGVPILVYLKCDLKNVKTLSLKQGLFEIALNVSDYINIHQKYPINNSVSEMLHISINTNLGFSYEVIVNANDNLDANIYTPV